MKRAFLFIFGFVAIALSSSCEKEIDSFDDNGTDFVATGKLTAVFSPDTKVSYYETAVMNLHPSWEAGDIIIGFDEEENTYTLTVTSVSGNTAVLEGTVPDACTLHLIYLSGAVEADISDGKLPVSYSDQSGDKTMPAAMVADGTVIDGHCEFHFRNAGGVIGISAVSGVPQGANIASILIEGENLSEGTVTLEDSELALNASPKADDCIRTVVSGLSVTDNNGTLSTPVIIAVPAGARIAKVSAIVPNESETPKIPDAVNGTEGVDFVTIAGLKWAKWNIGASGELSDEERAQYTEAFKEYGWHFAWGAPDGYFRYADSWQSGKADYFSFSYSPSSPCDVAPNDYLYVNVQKFDSNGHLFQWITAPFNNGTSGFNSTYFDSMYDVFCPDGVLAPAYDTATSNWGETWRMPTAQDYANMANATYWAWKSGGYYVFNPTENHVAGSFDDDFPDDLDVADAILFFPGCGYGANNEHNMIRRYGYYWTSNYGSYPSMAFAFSTYFTFISIGPNHIYYGLPVRAVSDY